MLAPPQEPLLRAIAHHARIAARAHPPRPLAAEEHLGLAAAGGGDDGGAGELAGVDPAALFDGVFDDDGDEVGMSLSAAATAAHARGAVRATGVPCPLCDPANRGGGVAAAAGAGAGAGIGASTAATADSCTLIEAHGLWYCRRCQLRLDATLRIPAEALAPAVADIRAAHSATGCSGWPVCGLEVVHSVAMLTMRCSDCGSLDVVA